MSDLDADDLARICDAGRCGCGARIVRGNDDLDELVTVNPHPIGAATELLAYTAGQPSWELALLPRPRGLLLTRRTERDIKRRPAGFKRYPYVVLKHDCTNRKGAS